MNLEIKKIIKVIIILFILDLIYLYLNQNWYKKEIYRSQKSELELKWFGVFVRYIAHSLMMF